MHARIHPNAIYLERDIDRIARTGRVGDATENVGGFTVRGEGRLGRRERGDALYRIPIASRQSVVTPLARASSPAFIHSPKPRGARALDRR